MSIERLLSAAWAIFRDESGLETVRDLLYRKWRKCYNRATGGENQMKSFGTALRKARNEAGLTQMELAKLLGVSFCTVNRYENGRHAPKKIVKEKLEKLFDEKGIAFVCDDFGK